MVKNDVFCVLLTSFLSAFMQFLGPNSQPGPSTGTQGQYAPAIPGGTQPKPVRLGLGSDVSMYELDDEEKMKIRAEKAARAAGWSTELSKERALEEAFGSL